MKAVLVTLLLAGAFSANASVFQCRSQKTALVLVASTSKREITLKDRFGNELDVLDEVESKTITLMTEPVTEETVFIRWGETVLVVSEQAGRVSAEYMDDSSFQCKKY